jgi:superfamily II DNA or RNA helicase
MTKIPAPLYRSQLSKKPSSRLLLRSRIRLGPILDPALQIDTREYQQAALDAWRTHDRRGSVVLPTGSGKTFLGIQAIADAGVAALVVAPTIDLMNQWHATLTNAFGDQLLHKGGDGIEQAVGVLGGGTHEIRSITVTTYDSRIATSTSTATSSAS